MKNAENSENKVCQSRSEGVLEIGEYEVLVTHLLDGKPYPTTDFKSIYAQPGGVDMCAHQNIYSARAQTELLERPLRGARTGSGNGFGEIL